MMNKMKVLLFGYLFLVACADNSNVQPNVIVDSQDAIIGGVKVEPGTQVMRSTVAIYDMSEQALCTGSLISSDIVLTAAHCVGKQPSKMLVIFTNDIKHAETDSKLIRFVSKARVHKDYNANKRFNAADIALVKFVGGLPAGYAPVKILNKPELLKTGSNVGVAGFGLSHPEDARTGDGSGVLRTTSIKILNSKYSATEISLDQSVKRGACSGDSGGPAFMMVNGRLNVWGVASRAAYMPGVPECTIYSLYTRADVFKGWISNKSAELSR
ncbi:MAG: S1 family peptidase [Bdellovibrio sp.]